MQYLDIFEKCIQINYDLQEISLLDTVNMSIDIHSPKDDLLFNTEKIVLYFQKDKYIKENNKKIKEILINKELSKDNPIQINYKYFKRDERSRNNRQRYCEYEFNRVGYCYPYYF